MDRIARLLGKANHSKQILELGAGYCPVAPKSGGWRTHVVDHATQDELRMKYAAANVDTSVIEEVDTIWHSGPLHEALPASLEGQIDLIIASHVLEHIPDLVGFFKSASRLVSPSGLLSIALPDRRYCFDCFRPWTTTGDLLEAHHRGSSRHNLKTAFDHIAYSAVVDGQLAWGPRPVGAPVLLDSFAAAADMVALFQDKPCGPYEDYHAWQFTPANFRLTMLELAALGILDWQVVTVDGPENFEFFAVLCRSCVERPDPVALQARRRILLLRQLAETREQIDFITAAEALSEPKGTGFEELIAKLRDQDCQLREMAETITWLRAILDPIRHAWRTVRGKV